MCWIGLIFTPWLSMRKTLQGEEWSPRQPMVRLASFLRYYIIMTDSVRLLTKMELSNFL